MTTAALTPRASVADVSLLDLIDRLLEGGICIHGEITLAAADIDLVRLSLRVLLGSVDTLDPGPAGGGG